MVAISAIGVSYVTPFWICWKLFFSLHVRARADRKRDAATPIHDCLITITSMVKGGCATRNEMHARRFLGIAGGGELPFKL